MDAFSQLCQPMVNSLGGVSLGLVMLCRFFSFLAHRKPHALQSVLGPLGPFRHSGESMVPVVRVSIFRSGLWYKMRETYHNQYRHIRRPLSVSASSFQQHGHLDPLA